MKKLLYFFCVLAGHCVAQTGNLGLPPVTNFPKTSYRAGTQNWDIAQDAQGRMLFANNEGLLLFDGTRWQRFPIGNGTCVRSVAVGPGGKIYVGGQGEIGFFSPDARGRLQYQSLNQLVPAENRQFTDVWDIAVSPEGAVCFRSAEWLLQYKNEKIRAFSSGGNLWFLGKTSGGKLLIQDSNNGLMWFDGDHFSLLTPGAKPASLVTALLPLGPDSTLVTTLKNGIFLLAKDQFLPWTTPIDPYLKEKRIYHAARTPGGDLALGTSLGGLVVLGTDRRPLQWLQKSEGLLTANVLSVFCDRARNLWLGLDNGISEVEINSPFYRIFPDGSLEGTGYAARVFQQKLYLGTSNGLFYKPFGAYANPFQHENFNLVQGTTGQVWSLDEVGGQLLPGHHEGPLRVDKDRANPLVNIPGAWRFVPINDTAMVAGQYDGLTLFTRPPGGAWQFRRRLAGLNESCRVMVREKDGTLWVSHPYRGVFRVRIRDNFRDLEVRLLGEQDGLPSNLNNYVFEIDGTMLVAAERGIFRFDAPSGRFVAHPGFDGRMGGSGRTRFLGQDQRGNVWFCKGEDTGVLWIEDGTLEKKIRRQVFPQLAGQLVGGFEHISPVDAHNVFFGAEKGFLHLDPERLRQLDTSLNVLISNVFLTNSGDSLLAAGYSDIEQLGLPYRLNSLRFAFSAPVYGAARRVQYSCRLEGLEKNWSAWSEKTEREFPHLGAGDYVFWVKARNEFGVESAAQRFVFVVHPPWYASTWAWLLYAALLALGLRALFRRQKRRFETEKASLTTEHRLQTEAQQRLVEQTEQELVRLQNEKLASEVAHKNQELALATLHLVQKGEILSSIQEELTRALESKSDPKALRADLSRMVRALQMDEQTDADWEQFAIHFDQVHGDFLKRLREKYPQLTPHDHRLCAYLRMNLSTKEIANLLNISVRGVEGSRYRLRKKMDLPGDANLPEVMLQV
ncbi:MAG: hypothetical protein IT260_02640 [Saprospiraceae bacterium]|nr:hypothetical protein [Saprospiraceae bacterium]